MVTISNPSDQDVNISEKLLKLHVLDHEGNTVPVPVPEPARDSSKLPKPGAMGSSFIGLLLQPGKSMEFEKVLNKKFDISKPGKYTVQATWQIGATTLKSNKITINVTP